MNHDRENALRNTQSDTPRPHPGQVLPALVASAAPPGAPTRWSVVKRARSDDPEMARAALQELIKLYWYTAYLAARSCPECRALAQKTLCPESEVAADAVQRLFTSVIGRDSLQTIAVPVHVPGGRPGILVATLDSGSTFGKLSMPDQAEDGTETRVVAYQDRNGPDDKLPARPVPFAQNHLARGAKHAVWTVDERESTEACISAVQGGAVPEGSSVTATAKIPGTKFVVCETTPLGRSIQSQQLRQERIKNLFVKPAFAGLGVFAVLAVASSVVRMRKRR